MWKDLRFSHRKPVLLADNRIGLPYV